jgi:phosphoglycerol transferase
VLLTFVLAGRFDASLSGPSYAIMLEAGFAPWPVVRNAAGHAMALLVLVGVPLWIVARHVVHALARRTRADDLALLALCIVAALVAMTVVFSSSVYTISPGGERITRLHGRYYAFALPLPIIAFAALSRAAEPWRPGRGALLLWASVAFAAIFGLAIGYETTSVDFADLTLLTRWPVGALPAALAAGCAIVAAKVAPRSAPIAWWGTIAIATSLALLVAPFTRVAFMPNAVDHALATPALRALVGRDDVMVVGTQHEATEPYRVMFGLASLARGRIVAAGTTIAPEQVPADVRVLILLPRVAFGGAADTAQVGPLTLVTLP